MAPKPLLHELLQQDQDPFHLKTYITNKRSQLNSPSPQTSLQLRKRRPILHHTPTNRTNLCKRACFFSFQNSPELRRSPFVDLPSPVKSPCKSPNASVFLHIPSRTATILVEAAMRIQRQQQSKPKSQSRIGFGLLGSFLKRLKDRRNNRKLAIEHSDIINETYVEESYRMSCSRSNGRLSSADWTDNNEDISLDLEASTSSRVSNLSEVFCRGDYCLSEETCFCSSSPFRFSLHKSSSPNGHRTPEFSSPAASPSRRVKQEKANSDNVQGENEEEKEQCSPVSVLEPPFDEDEERESGDAEEGDEYDMECSHHNVQRAKQQLLYRIQGFEIPAELDPVELEKKLLEGSNDEGQVVERDEPDGNEPLSPYRKQHGLEMFVSQVLNQSNLKYHSRSITADMKKLVSDLIVEEKREMMIQPCGNEIVMGRIRNRLDLWKEVEFNTIDMMIGLDLKKDIEGWTKFGKQVQETAEDIEVAIYMVLMQELTEELSVF